MYVLHDHDHHNSLLLVDVSVDVFSLCALSSKHEGEREDLRKQKMANNGLVKQYEHNLP